MCVQACVHKYTMSAACIRAKYSHFYLNINFGQPLFGLHTHTQVHIYKPAYAYICKLGRIMNFRLLTCVSAHYGSGVAQMIYTHQTQGSGRQYAGMFPLGICIDLRTFFHSNSSARKNPLLAVAQMACNICQCSASSFSQTSIFFWPINILLFHLHSIAIAVL